MLESAYQRKLIKTIQEMFPGCFILKNDPAVHQGIPDLLVLWRDTWFMLETKRASNASRRPNQDHYIAVFDEMSFASFICPENEEEVLNAIQSTLRPSR